jgi:hypothetical protein
MKTLELEGDLETVEVKLKIKGKVIPFTLSSMTGVDRERHFDNMSANTYQEVRDGKPVNLFKKIEGMRAALLVLCMKDAEGKPVTAEFVNALPPKTLEALYEEAGRLSALSDEAKEEAKKD